MIRLILGRTIYRILLSPLLVILLIPFLIWLVRKPPLWIVISVVFVVIAALIYCFYDIWTKNVVLSSFSAGKETNIYMWNNLPIRLTYNGDPKVYKIFGADIAVSPEENELREPTLEELEFFCGQGLIEDIGTITSSSVCIR